MGEDAKVLRKLAHEYFAIANSDKNACQLELHKAVNDLKQIRPVVLIDEIPWNEMNINKELTEQCVDPYLREIERFFRRNIYKNKYLPADMYVPTYIPINKVIHSTGIGISVEEKVLSAQKGSHILAHEYKDILQTQEDIERIQKPIIHYDKEETLRRYHLVGEILSDILPVKITGVNAFFVSTWDDIARYRGVTNLLIDLAERPLFLHQIMHKLTEVALSKMEQMETLGLLENYPFDLHCTPAQTNHLPSADFDGVALTRKDVWGRGAAQIFASVSKKMHEEFDIEYMKKTIGQCGLVYYGCCEPLDKKIDIVEKIPNLRKISITPWANVNIAAEAINKRYVLSSKPNPAAVAVPILDKENLRQEISAILDACRKNNCSCDIVLKDISTCCKRPENIFEWEKVTMELVKSY